MQLYEVSGYNFKMKQHVYRILYPKNAVMQLHNVSEYNFKI